MAQRAIFAVTPLVSAASVHAQAAQPTHSLSREYGAVRLSYDDLANLIQRIRVQTSSANAAYRARYSSPSERLEIKRGDVGITFPTGFSTEALSRAPGAADSFWYRYEYGDAPIAQVDIQMSDLYRQVKVEGTVVEQVEALSAIIDSQVNGWVTSLRGRDFRFWMGALLFVLALVLAFVPAMVAKPSELTLRRGAIVLLEIVAVLLLLLVYIPPWRRWAPGVALLRGDINVIRRYGVEISLVIGLLGLLPFAALVRWFQRRGPSTPPAAGDTPPPAPPSPPK